QRTACELGMMRLAWMRNPGPLLRRAGSNLHGASQTGCWLNVMIWMTERSGSAAKPEPAKTTVRTRHKNLFDTRRKWLVLEQWSSNYEIRQRHSFVERG